MRANRDAAENLSRGWVLLAIMSCLALMAAACGGGDDEAPDLAAPGPLDDGETEPVDEGEPVEGGALEVGLEAETANWLPSTGNWASSGYNVAYAIHDPLMARTDTGDVEPYLAESLTPDEELTEYTLTLRPGVTFHDGTPLDAAAIKSNFDGHLKAPGSVLAGQLTEVESFEVTGPLTGVYHLTQANAAFPDLLTTAAGMPFSPTAAAAAGPDYGASPVGTGAFRFVSWLRDSRIELEAYEDYWQEGLPYLDRLTFRPIPDEDTRLQSLLAGDIDAMTTLRQSIVRQALDAEDVETKLYIGNNGGGAVYNTLVPPVDDQRVRLGLAHAIDQDDLVEVLGGTGITPPQTQYFSPDNPFYSEDAAEAWPVYDVDRANELLDAYEQDPNRSDGKAPGEPISIRFNCPPDPSLIELSQTYQAFWSAIGVEVELNSVEQAAHIANAIGSAASDPPFKGDYMINCWRMGGEQDPYTILSNAFGPVAEQPLNFTNFRDQVIEENLEVLRTSTDFDERYAAAEQIMMHFTEQVPNLWTGGTAVMISNKPEVDGVGTWTLPDGTPGSGIPDAVTRWNAVWVDGS